MMLQRRCRSIGERTALIARLPATRRSSARPSSASLRAFEIVGRRLQHVVALLLDRIQDCLAAAVNSSISSASSRFTLLFQRQSPGEPFARPRHFIAHQLQKLRRSSALGNTVFDHAKAAHVFQRNDRCGPCR